MIPDLVSDEPQNGHGHSIFGPPFSLVVLPSLRYSCESSL